MWVAAFFVLLAVVIITRFVGNRLFPIVLPAGLKKTLGLGWLGGLAGIVVSALLDLSGFSVAGINVLAAFSGCLLFLLVAGLIPFIRIALGKA